MDVEPARDQLAEGRVARTRAVREDRLAVAREDGLGAVGQLLEREQVGAEAVCGQRNGGQALLLCKT
jgi:hypothetical protein